MSRYRRSRYRTWKKNIANRFAGSRVWHKLHREKRDKIFERDNQRCVGCGAKEGLNLAHIVSSGYEKYPSRNEWVWDYEGKEFCPRCESYSFYERKTKEPRYRCKICGMEFNKAVSAEKVWNKAWKRGKKMANDLVEGKMRELEKYFDDENLITLCNRCHLALDTRTWSTSEPTMDVKRSVRQWLKDHYGPHYRKELEKKYGEWWHTSKL